MTRTVKRKPQGSPRSPALNDRALPSAAIADRNPRGRTRARVPSLRRSRLELQRRPLPQARTPLQVRIAAATHFIVGPVRRHGARSVLEDDLTPPPPTANPRARSKHNSPHPSAARADAPRGSPWSPPPDAGSCPMIPAARGAGERCSAYAPGNNSFSLSKFSTILLMTPRTTASTATLDIVLPNLGASPATGAPAPFTISCHRWRHSTEEP